MDQFPDEESCKLKFKSMRDEAGVTRLPTVVNSQGYL